MKPNKTALSPHINTDAADWLESVFGTRNAGATFWLNEIPALYRQTLAGIAGIFLRSELELIIEVLAGQFDPLTKGLQSYNLIDLRVTEHYNVKGDHEPHDKDAFIDKIIHLSPFEATCLAIIAVIFPLLDDKEAIMNKLLANTLR